MSRLPSEATQLRAAKSEIRSIEKALDQSRALTRELNARAIKAEQELAEWKTRFDILLRRDQPKESA